MLSKLKNTKIEIRKIHYFVLITLGLIYLGKKVVNPHRPVTETYFVVSGPGPSAYPLPFQLADVEVLQTGSTFTKNTCGYCGKFFSSSTKRKRHEMEVHSVVKFKCPVCLKNYNTARIIQRHLEQIHGQEINVKDADQFMIGRDDE